MMKTMKKKGIIMGFIGWVLFMAGIFTADLSIVIGTVLSVAGGSLMGGSTYFTIDVKQDDNS